MARPGVTKTSIEEIEFLLAEAKVIRARLRSTGLGGSHEQAIGLLSSAIATMHAAIVALRSGNE